METKLLQISSVDFDVIDQLPIICSAIVRFWMKDGSAVGSTAVCGL
jgi:hypothetical protein